MESKDEALRSQVAIRCAKASILLYSLKSFPNRHFKTTTNDKDKVSFSPFSPLSLCRLDILNRGFIFIPTQ